MQTHTSALLAALSVSVLSACQPVTPRLDAHFGEAVNVVKAQQTINPDASRNTDPVAGIDGASAKSTIDTYNKTFEAPPPTTITNTINVGGGGGGK